MASASPWIRLGVDMARRGHDPDSDIAASGATALSVSRIGWLPNRTVIVCSANNAANSSLMETWNVGLIGKCSGCHCVNPAVYGTNRGREVEVIQFPVNHLRKVRKVLPELLLKMKRVWQAGQAVMFHCNGGIHRAPAGYAIAMANINGSSIKDELDYLRRWRPEIHETYKYCFDEGYNIDKCSIKDLPLVTNLWTLDAEIPRPNWDSNGNRNCDRDGHSNGNKNWDWYWDWHSNSWNWHWNSNGNWNSSVPSRASQLPLPKYVCSCCSQTLVGPDSLADSVTLGCEECGGAMNEIIYPS